MARPPEKIVHDIGKQLAQKGRLSKDFVVTSLREAAKALIKLNQVSALEPLLRPLSTSLVDHRLLGHKDKDVRVLVAICFCEIMRVLAPDPNFDDKTYKDIFNLYINMFMELGNTNCPFFTKRVKILETVDKLECCKQMLDIGCDELILKMFRTFFFVVSEKHPSSVVNGMLSIMTLILKEEEISPELLEVILENLTNRGEGPPSTSYQLAVKLIEQCSDRIKPAACKYLTCCILDTDDTQSELRGCYHQIIFEIFKCAPHMLTAIIPSIIQESMTDQVDVRIKSLNLIGKLLTLPKTYNVPEHHQLLNSLLNRLVDKVAGVRISALHILKNCYVANPLGPESQEILSSLGNRMLDFDTKTRTEAVAAVCDLALFRMKAFPPELLGPITERLRDKMVSVREKTLRKLLEVYHYYCTMCCEGQMALGEFFEQIPCKIVALYYDKNVKEFRPHDLEILLAKDLFPDSLSVEERTKHWIFLYSIFSGDQLKAFSSMLCQKRRFQSLMRVYLSYWKMDKENAIEGMAARLKATILQLSAVFPIPSEAQRWLSSLQEVKDDQICIGLTKLLDEVSFENAKTTRAFFLKNTGDKNPRPDLLELLSLRCFHNIFNVEHVQCILQLQGISDKRDNISKDLLFNLLQVILDNIPDLLATAGTSVSDRISDVYPALESFCLEGTRSQSKIAVSAIAALAGSSKHVIFADLFQKLEKSLNDGNNISTVLQSLGCTAQHSDLAFQNQNEISSFIKGRIFEGQLSAYSPSHSENSGHCFSFNCKTKIYGVKTLVKLHLPKKGAEDRDQLDSLVNILFKLLQKSACTGLSVMSGNDADLVRLTAAKCILRLSARWDTHISPQIFQFTVMLAKDSSFSLRRLFLDKTHKLLKKHAIPDRYACAFLLASSDRMKVVRDVSISYLAEFIDDFSKAAEVDQVLALNGRNVTAHPAYIVVYLIYILAHDGGFPPGNCQDEKVFAHFCRPLFILVHSLRNAQCVTGDTNPVKSSLLHLLNLFRAVKRAEDAIDPQSTHKLHKLADIGKYFVRVVKPEGVNLPLASTSVLLPSSLYRASKSTEGSSGRPAGFSFDERFLKKVTGKIEDTFEQPSSVSTLKCNMYAQMEVSRGNTIDDITDNMSNGMPNEAGREGMDQQTIDETDSINVEMEVPDVSVIRGSGVPEGAPRKENSLVFCSGASTMSTETLDASFSASTLQDHKRKGSTNCSKSKKSSKTKESTVPSSKAQKEIKTQSTGVITSKGKALCDRTNSLAACAANNQKKHTPEKRQRVAGDPSPAIEDATEDCIAYRTRRRKA